MKILFYTSIFACVFMAAASLCEAQTVTASPVTSSGSISNAGTPSKTVYTISRSEIVASTTASAVTPVMKVVAAKPVNPAASSNALRAALAPAAASAETSNIPVVSATVVSSSVAIPRKDASKASGEAR